MRADKGDRYGADSPKKSHSPSLKLAPMLSGTKLSKTKLIILALALFIIILLLSFAFFASNSADKTTAQPLDTQVNNEQELNYQNITAPIISPNATESRESIVAQERLEIPGEVTDLLSQKIAELDKNDNVTDTAASSQVNELPLVDNIAPTNYTIQISASSSEESLIGFVKKNNISNYLIYTTIRNQKPWFVLIKGNYSTIDEAKQAIKSLPAELQKSNPWIKSGTAVNNEKKAE